jgi:hypothetical protein
MQDLQLKYAHAYILHQKIEERNIRKQNVAKRKEEERDQALLTAIKERGIQMEGTGEEYVFYGLNRRIIIYYFCPDPIQTSTNNFYFTLFYGKTDNMRTGVSV